MGRIHNDGLTQDIQDFFMSKINIEGPFQPNKWYYDMDDVPQGFLKYYPEINAFINNNGKFYNTNFNVISGSKSKNQTLENCLAEHRMPAHLLGDVLELRQKHLTQIVQIIVLKNRNLSGTYVLDKNSREIIYSSPSTEAPIDVDWEAVCSYILTRYGNDA
jgi:hypothetical protein